MSDPAVLPSTMRLAGKTALVTGAASGIGRQSVRRFAAEGANVIAVDRDDVGLAETLRQLSAAGLAATSFEVDLADARACRAMAAAVVSSAGPIHVLFNNAGAVEGGTVEDTPDDVLDRMLATNFKATFTLSGAVIPSMKQAGGGAIVNNASIAAYVGVTNESAYSASKGAVISLTRSMALDYAPYNIRVNCICPGLTWTPMVEAFMGADEVAARVARKYPLRRVGTASDIAAVALFLASDEAAFITGIVLPVDGGMSAQ